MKRQSDLCVWGWICQTPPPPSPFLNWWDFKKQSLPLSACLFISPEIALCSPGDSAVISTSAMGPVWIDGGEEKPWTLLWHRSPWEEKWGVRGGGGATVEPAGDLTSKKTRPQVYVYRNVWPFSLLSMDSVHSIMELLSLQAGRGLGDNSVKPFHSIDEKIKAQERQDLPEVTKPHPGVFSQYPSCLLVEDTR